MKKNSITLGKVFVILIFLILSTKFHSQEKPNFKNNQSICFIGNSITQDGRYHMLLQTYFATRYPSIKLNYMNCGISGDVAMGMLDRFDKDILIHKPDYAFLMVGMNDIMSYLYEPSLKVNQEILNNRQKALENYYTRTEKLATKLVKNNITPIFLTPSIYDQTSTLQTTNKFGINDALEKCAVHIRKLAKKHNGLLVDFQPEMLRLNKQIQKEDPSKTIISQDRVHPGDTGHFIMMNTILNTIEKSNKVSEVKINAKKRKLISTEKSKVTLEPDSNILTFRVNNNSLPFPLNKKYGEADQLVDFTKNYNRDILKITQLKKGTYQLIIDKIKIGSFTSKQLKKGINLSAYSNTPQSTQSKEIARLCELYHKTNGDLRIIGLVEYKNLKNYQGPNDLDAKRSYLKKHVEKQKGKSWHPYIVKTTNRYFEVVQKQDSLWTELNRLRDLIYSENKIQSHNYSIIKID